MDTLKPSSITENIKPPQPSYMRTKNKPALDYQWLSSKTETESEWLLDDLCNYVINMGSPCQWAYSQGILWEAFHKWINEKPRQKKYFEALMTQNETVVLTLLQDLRDYNSFDIRDVLDDDGKVKPPAQWPDRAAKAIEEMDVTEKVTGDVTYTIRTVRKLKAVEMLMKNLNVLADRVVLCKQVKETGNDFIDKFFGLSPENDSIGHDQDDSKECDAE